MERLTTDKNVQEMGMVELAYNCCIAKDGKAVYRDFDGEVDAREFARALYKSYTSEELSKDDDVFDDEMLENLQYDPANWSEGLIALFYRNLWAMADLRERLKRYEDAKEQGLLLPCRFGDKVYTVEEWLDTGELSVLEYTFNGIERAGYRLMYEDNEEDVTVFGFDEIGKTVFLSQSEAEQELERRKHE